MKRVLGIGRGRAGRVGLVAGVVVAAVVGLSAPAFAHHATLSGVTSCSDGTIVVNWTIANSENDKFMTITAASAAVGNQSFGVSGYAAPVAKGGSTTATSVFPAGTTGSAVLSISTSWTNGVTWSGNSAPVALISNCGTTTTTEAVTTTTHRRCECTTTTLPETTTTHETTTTVADTTTTLPVTTTSEIHELGSTTIYTTTTLPKHHTPSTVVNQGSTIVVPTTKASSTTVPVLPHTGGDTTIPAIFGGLCIAAGAALGLRKRNPWSSRP